MAARALLLRSLPKAHLHLHFVGAMRPTTLQELMEREGRAPLAPQVRYGTFADFQDRYIAAVEVLRSYGDLARLLDEIVEDAAADGALWIEPAVNLTNHLGIGPPEEVLESLVGVAGTAGTRHGIGVGLIVEADRTLPVATAIEQARLAARFAGRGVVGFGLANEEAAAPTGDFVEAFAIAREAGLLSVPHAGEHGGSDSVSQAIELLGASRIAHGIRAIEDPELIRRIATESVCLDVAPTSNFMLSVTAEDAHPLTTLLSSGVRCSINADDPLLFNVGILDEYERCRDVLGVSADQLARCSLDSLLFSGAPSSTKNLGKKRIEEWLADTTRPGNVER